MHKKLFLLFIISIAFFSTSPAFSDIHYVSSERGSSENYPGTTEDPLKFIGEGLSAASPGDSVYVQAGTYEEWTHILRPVYLVGGWDADFTSIVGRSVIISPDKTEYDDVPPIQISIGIDGKVAKSVDDELLIQNFKLQCLGVPSGGGGISGGHEITATIDNCLIEGNTVEAHGGAIRLGCGGNSKTTFSSNIIRNNTSEIVCGGIYISDTKNGLSPTVHFINNMIYENNDSGIYVISHEETDEHGIFVNLLNNTISRQETGLYLNPYSSGRIEANLINNILWGNTAYDIVPYMYTTYTQPERSTVYAGHCIYETVKHTETSIQDQGGNFSEDPLLKADYTLSPNSPAIGKGLCALFDGTRVAPPTDYEDNPRPENCSLHCIEYASADNACINGYYEGCAISAD